MTEEFYSAKNRDVYHTTFGGIIYPSDFETDYRGQDNNNGSPIARRIASDQRVDEQCRKDYYGRLRRTL